MADKVIEFIRQCIVDIKWDVVFLAVVGLIFKAVAKYIKKKYNELEGLRDEVKEIADQVESWSLRDDGRRSFASSVDDHERRIENHEIRISCLETIVERRRQSLLVDFPERRNL
jgi:hypothetical protein